MRRPILMTKDEVKAERVRSMSATFSRADTTLAGRRVRVAVEHSQIKAPAYSIGDDIVLNLTQIGDVDTTDDIIKVTGLNFHELAHAEYTPRDDHTGLIKDLKDEGLFRYFNMLEDQRIETLLSTKYPAMKPYFTMTIMRYIAGDDSDLTTAHALTYGRKYLPKEIRKGLRDAWKYPKVIDRLEAIIDEFRTLTFPSHNGRGLRLVRELRDLLNEATGHDKQQQPGCPYGHATEQGESGARPDDQRGTSWGGPKEAKQKDAQDERAEQEADGEADGDDDGEDTDGKGKGKGKKGKGKPSDSDADEDGAGDGDGDQDSDADGDDEDGSGKKAGRGNAQEPSVVDPQSLKDMAKKIADSAASSPEVQQDARRKRDAMHKMDGSIPLLDLSKYSEDDPTLESIHARNGFKRHLLKLWADADPGWHTHRSSGKVNIARAMKGDDFDTVFDEWDPGKNDVTDIELIILADYSSSMRDQMWDVSQAIWTIKTAVEAVKGDVTVIGFADSAQTFYTKDDRAQRNKVRIFGAKGGTQPWEALREVRKMMHFSKRKHRILVILTDGDWSDVQQSRIYGGYTPAPAGTQEHEEIIRMLNADGVVTALAFLKDTTSYWGRQQPLNAHACQVAHQIDDPAGLVVLAERIVKQAMSN